jgi:hypothetical protein
LGWILQIRNRKVNKKKNTPPAHWDHISVFRPSPLSLHRAAHLPNAPARPKPSFHWPGSPTSQRAAVARCASQFGCCWLKGLGGGALNRASTIPGCVGPTHRAPPSSWRAVTTEPRMAGSSSDPTSPGDKTPPSGYLCPLLLPSSPQYFHCRRAITVSREGENHAAAVGFPSSPPLGCQSLTRKLRSAGGRFPKTRHQGLVAGAPGNRHRCCVRPHVRSLSWPGLNVEY